MSELKKITLCCDDGGCNAENDDLLAQLAKEKRVSAISIMSHAPNSFFWHTKTNLPQSCSLGLHFNLTWSPEQHSRGLRGLITNAFLRSLSLAELEEKFRQQLTTLEKILDQAPAFIDGHQHVHILPVVRNAVINVIKQRYGEQKNPVMPMVRIPISNQWSGTKAWLINQLGARDLRNLLLSHNIGFNDDFAGVYDLSPKTNFSQCMRNWLQNLNTNGLIMSHPGLINNMELAAARNQEALFFLSDEWPKMLIASNAQLQPFQNPLLQT